MPMLYQTWNEILEHRETEEGVPATFVWEVWTGRPAIDRRFFNRFRYAGFIEHPDPPEGFEPHSLPVGILILAVTAFFRCWQIFLAGVLLPFTLIWLCGALLGHSLFFRWWIVYCIAGALIMLAIAFTQKMKSGDMAKEADSARLLATSALTFLPFLMYANAAPGAFPFQIFGLESPNLGLWNWILFYSYVLLDSLLFGAPEALLGDFVSFQPPSLVAAISTLLLKVIMGIGAIALIVGHVSRKLFCNQEFVGTVDHLFEWLTAHDYDRDEVYVVATAIEQPLPNALPIIPASKIAAGRPKGKWVRLLRDTFGTPAVVAAGTIGVMLALGLIVGGAINLVRWIAGF